MLKSLVLALSVAVLSAGMLPSAVDAKRIGGGGSSGMQRSTPSQAPNATPAKPAQAAPAAPNTAGAAPAAAAPKRSWMGPIAGLAAGLGIAALMSHLGMGAAMGNMLMMALLAVAAFFVIRFVMSRFAKPNGANGNQSMATPSGMQFAGSAGQPPFGGASTGSGWGQPAAAVNSGSPMLSSMSPGNGFAAGTGTGAAMPVSMPLAAASGHLPEGFDVAGFERIAKMIFIRMQAANDSADLNDLRTFTTPEMFAAVKLELQDRGTKTQRTDVVRVDAEVLDVSTEGDRQIVSVRFHGLIREEENAVAAPFDEAWHLVKPVDGSQQWAIAGIQQTAATNH